MGGNEQQDTGELQHERREHANAGRWEPDMVAPTPDTVAARIRTGMTVVDRHGDRIGTVAGVYTPVGLSEFNADPYDAYVKVDRGLLFGDLYVPSRFVGQVGADGVMLTVSEGEMRGLDWHKPEWMTE